MSNVELTTEDDAKIEGMVREAMKSHYARGAELDAAHVTIIELEESLKEASAERDKTLAESKSRENELLARIAGLEKALAAKTALADVRGNAIINVLDRVAPVLAVLRNAKHGIEVEPYTGGRLETTGPALLNPPEALTGRPQRLSVVTPSLDYTTSVEDTHAILDRALHTG